jgi:membrane-associated phospholipid phosphatase
VAAGGYFFYSVLSDPRDIGWTWRARLPGDEFVRDRIVAKGQAGRRKISNMSNRLWHIIELFPLADGLVAPLLFDDFNVDVAWQLTALNLQGIAVMGAINRLTHDFTRRARPALQGCREQGDEYSHYCTTTSATPNQSFISGHAASVFYGAGATCAHHLALPMYGQRAADIGICALGLAAATAAGTLRIVADTHWMTDVLAGAVAGFGAGWGLAYGLHYSMPLKKMHEASLMVLPIASAEKLELRVFGRL